MTPWHQQPAPCLRVQPPRAFQQLGPAHPRQILTGKYQGDRLAARGEFLQAGQRLRRGPEAHDLVMPPITVAELRLDLTQGSGILINGD